MAEFFLVVPSGRFHSAPTLGVVRKRLVSEVWTEHLVLLNHRDEHVPVSIDLEVGTDFADLFEVKNGGVAAREICVEHTDREVALLYRNGGLVRQTRIAVNADVDVPVCSPHLPDRFGRIALRRVPGRWGRSDVEAVGARRVDSGHDLDRRGESRAA